MTDGMIRLPGGMLAGSVSGAAGRHGASPALSIPDGALCRVPRPDGRSRHHGPLRASLPGYVRTNIHCGAGAVLD
jgi:hypothetical protein